MNKHLKFALIEYFNEILDYLNEYYCFFEYMMDSKKIYNWERDYRSFLKELEFKVTYGCTKIVIVPNNGEWVLKIPIGTEPDFCKIEVEKYLKAQKEGLENAFCESHFLMNYLSYPCYIMKRAQVDESELYSDIRQYLSNSNMSDEDIEEKMYDLDDEEMLRDFFLAYYEEDFVEKLLAFLYEEKINDVHSENVGYYNGYPIIFDYSGYWS